MAYCASKPVERMVNYLTAGQVLKTTVRLNILDANILTIKSITKTAVIYIKQFMNLTIRMLFIAYEV